MKVKVSRCVPMALCLLFFINCSSQSDMDDPDYDRDPCQLIVSRRFKCKTYYPITKDGYILTLYRIVNPYVNKTRGSFLYMHGLHGSAADLVMAAYGGYARSPESVSSETRPNGNLGFDLANHGYDVWLGNFRGNWYSMRHTKLKASVDKAYWDFTFDHHAEHDLPAITGFILKRTGESSLGYFGHSMGGYAVLALLASQPEKYSHVFKPAIVVGAGARLTHTRGNAFIAGATIPHFDSFMTAMGGPFPPQMPHQLFLKNLYCQGIFREVCRSLLLNIAAMDITNVNRTRDRVLWNHYPQTTSAATFAYFAQSTKGNRFNKFDYGPDENKRIHGTESVPQYPLHKIRSPYIALMYSKDDEICGIEDVQWLKTKLKVQLLDDYEVPFEGWMHHDFFWAKQAPELVFGRVRQLLDKEMPTLYHHRPKDNGAYGVKAMQNGDRFWYRLDRQSGARPEKVNYRSS